jgi:hypothetical protein
MKNLPKRTTRMMYNIAKLTVLESKGIPEDVSDDRSLARSANDALIALKSMADSLSKFIYCNVNLRMITEIVFCNKYTLVENSCSIDLLAILDLKYRKSYGEKKHYIISEAFHTASIPTGLLIPELPEYVSYSVTLCSKYHRLTVLRTELVKGQLYVLVKYRGFSSQDAESVKISHNDVFGSLIFNLNAERLIMEKQIVLTLQGCKPKRQPCIHQL